MMNKITMWIIGMLAVLAVSTTYLSYNLYGKLSVVQAQLQDSMQEMKKKSEALDKLDRSCSISSAISTEFFRESRENGTKIMELMSALNEYTAQESNNENQPTPSPINSGTVQPDPALQRLLDAAYCSAAPSDPTCTTK